MRYTPTPGVTPARTTTYETAARADRVVPVGEAQARHEIEQINREKRGYEVATARVHLQIAQATHLQAHIKLGTAHLQTDIAKHDFKRTAWSLVGKRVATATAEDTARAAVAEHSLNQTAIRQRLIGQELNTIEATQKNQERRSELALNGTLPRFNLTHG